MPPSAGSRSEHSHHSGYDDDETLMLEQAMDKADRASNRLEAIRAQALRDARDAEGGDFASARRGGASLAFPFAGPKADAREMASLVGKLERYAEAKTGTTSTTSARRNDGFASGGSNAARRVAARAGERAPFHSRTNARGGPSPFGSHADGARGAAPRAQKAAADKWGARRGANAAASTRRGAARDESPNFVTDENRDARDPTYANSLVGGWDAGSSRWDASSVPDSDVRSVYSAALEDSFGGAYALPDAPADEVARVDERAGAAAENLERHRAALERTVSRIARATRASDEAASLETDGMFTAGKTKTGVGVIDFFARDPVGAGPEGSLARSANDRADRFRQNASKLGVAEQKSKWLSPAPARRAARAAAPPEEPSPIVRMLRSVFGCGCGGR